MAAKKTQTARKKAGSSKGSASRSTAKKAPAANKKAAAKKKAVAKKPVAKKKAAAKKKAVAKKPVAKKKAAAKKKAVAKKPAAKKAAVKKTAAPKRDRTVKAATMAAAGSGNGSGNGSSSSAKPGKRKNKHLTAKELRLFHQLLLNLRDQVVDEISFLAGDNLSGKQLSRTGEEGTDNFNREFALKLVSNEQDIIYEIDEALQRIKHGTYGICEHSGEPIEKERLKVLPHARHCVRVQSELERGRARYRPFGPSIERG